MTHATVEVHILFSEAAHWRSSMPHPNTGFEGELMAYPVNDTMT